MSQNPVEWLASAAPQPYEAALAAMEWRVGAIRAGTAPELVWLLEHPPLYTAGTSAKPADLLLPGRFPVHQTGRGGKFTYHGPGQRVAYVMLDVGARGRDLRAFVGALEDWLIATLARFGVKGERLPGEPGIFVRAPAGPAGLAKIAALGLRLRHWVSFHGVALNVAPDLSHYDGIVPCGLKDIGVTSLHALGIAAPMDAVDAALRASFEQQFGADTVTPAGVS